ncbi:MAG: DUF2235 domain-containing protein, partial [Neisseriaceae bacterium]|nr:DUF2235 domain-containing protein [Neisseriaceae bacterium]
MEQDMSYRVNVFFDGTFNNILNLTSDETRANISYHNTPSNIAILYQNAKKYSDNDINVYVEGVSTKAGSLDNPLSAVLGFSKYGVTERIGEAFILIQSEFERLHPDNLPEALELNIYGFSRGAAKARSFAYYVKHEPQRFIHWHLNPYKITINFVGLFDTVPGYFSIFNPMDTVLEQESGIVTFEKPKKLSDIDDTSLLHLDIG